jgi:LCP family protein required for cell wall assembly
MAEFRTRRIRQKPPLKPLKKLKNGLVKCGTVLSSTTKKQRSYFLGSILILIAVLIVVKVTTGIYHFIRDFEPRDVVFALGTDLKHDVNDYTNIVLLGDGGHVRDGADLIDTIMVASIDFDGKTVSLMSIPRDYYVWSDKYGDAKINELYRNNKNEMGEEEAYDIYQDVAGEVSGLDIQYYLRVDFGAFVEVVDSIGGITIDVKEAIYDPYYPNESDNGYTVFEIDAGFQEIDGETALKFVRSRKTTSDFDRAARQQQVLMAIKDKALSGNVLTSPSKIKKLYQSISGNINTNVTLREMLALASFAKDFDRENMVMKVLHDDPSRDGGFLYTPERKYYNGQFVLVPDGVSLDMIHKYADLIFHKRDVLMHPVRIEVLNGTKEPGIARKIAAHLTRYGFDIVNIDNFLDKNGKRKYVERSFKRYSSWKVDMEGVVIAHHQTTLDALANFINGEAIPSDESEAENSEVDISIVIGSDYEIL